MTSFLEHIGHWTTSAL